MPNTSQLSSESHTLAEVKGDGRTRQPRHLVARSGVFLFAFAYSSYFAFGAINFIPLRGYVQFETVLIAVAGLVAFFLGVATRALADRPTKSSRLPLLAVSSEYAEPHGWKNLVRVSAAVGVVAVLGILVEFKGIPLFAGESRLQVSGYLAVLIYGGVIAIVISGAHAIHRNASGRYFLRLACYGLLLLVMGFRTVTLVVLMTILIQGRIEGRYRLRPRIVLLVVCSIFAFSWLAVYRFGAGATAWFTRLRRLGLDDGFSLIAPIWATPREGVSVFNILVQQVPDRQPFRHGEVLASAFSTILPGHQLGPRLLVAQYVDGRPGITITPSLLGEPYLDFGVAGVIGFMFVVGFAMWSLYRWQQEAVTWAPQLAYAYILACFFLDIHSGFVDISIISTCIGFFAYGTWAESRARKNIDPGSLKHSREGRS